MFNRLVGFLFGEAVTDMLSGYRVLSRRFVKSFPALSREFEIETELTVHTMRLRVPQTEVRVGFRDRPDASVSKLRTYHDGFRILRLVAQLLQHERPVVFYGLGAACGGGATGVLAVACSSGTGVRSDGGRDSIRPALGQAVTAALLGLPREVIRLPTRTSSGAGTRTPGAFLRYLLVGGFNTLLDLGLFTLFAVVAGLDPLIANILSTSTTLCVSYLLNRVFVFRTERSIQRTAVQFVAVTLISGLVVQSAVIWVIMGLGVLIVPDLPSEVLAPLAKICAMGVGMGSNYLGYRWLFGSR